MSNNPYQAPSADIRNPVDSFEGYDETKFYSPKGRFNRSRYLVYGFLMLLPIIVIGIIAAIAMPGLMGGDPEALGGAMFGVLGLLFIPIGIAMFVLAIIFMIRRLHDMDLSGWWTIALILISMIPFVSLLVYLFLYLKPGTPGPNRFGPPGPPNSDALKVGTWICGAIMAIGFIANVAILVLGVGGAAAGF